MSIKQITTDDLRRMKDSEGIVFQGCGGDPQEWVQRNARFVPYRDFSEKDTKYSQCTPMGRRTVPS